MRSSLLPLPVVFDKVESHRTVVGESNLARERGVAVRISGPQERGERHGVRQRDLSERQAVASGIPGEL